jgi:hypothetical protein
LVEDGRRFWRAHAKVSKNIVRTIGEIGTILWGRPTKERVCDDG